MTSKIDTRKDYKREIDGGCELRHPSLKKGREFLTLLGSTTIFFVSHAETVLGRVHTPVPYCLCIV